jgi:hypothetical protein
MCDAKEGTHTHTHTHIRLYLPSVTCRGLEIAEGEDEGVSAALFLLAAVGRSKGKEEGLLFFPHQDHGSDDIGQGPRSAHVFFTGTEPACASRLGGAVASGGCGERRTKVIIKEGKTDLPGVLASVCVCVYMHVCTLVNYESVDVLSTYTHTHTLELQPY